MHLIGEEPQPFSCVFIRACRVATAVALASFFVPPERTDVDFAGF